MPTSRSRGLSPQTLPYWRAYRACCWPRCGSAITLQLDPGASRRGRLCRSLDLGLGWPGNTRRRCDFLVPGALPRMPVPSHAIIILLDPFAEPLLTCQGATAQVWDSAKVTDGRPVPARSAFTTALQRLAPASINRTARHAPRGAERGSLHHACCPSRATMDRTLPYITLGEGGHFELQSI
jgi:hypothetical protein